ncbi:MAG: cell wall hydrolase [Oscillospiraceae bacterium]|nr:cell wall hydrolase [Oscillospiraceae bacterium]
MKKTILTLIAAAVLFTAASAGAMCEAQSAVTVYVDGELVDTAGLSYIENGATYVPVREMCRALGATRTEWTGSESVIEAEGLGIRIAPGELYFTANGRCVYTEHGCLLRSGRLMAHVRPLCAAYGADVEWNGAEKAVYIKTGGDPIQPGDEFYDDNDLYWLSRIIQAEAGGESLEGKIAVGNVVLNRVESPLFPNSVYDVIFDKKYGVQFTPAYSGGLKREPPDEAVAAAKLALEGVNTAQGSLYFVAARAASSSWAGRNREFVSQIGNHCFYA